MAFVTGQILTAEDLNAATEKTKRRGTRDTTSNNSTSVTAVGVLRIDGITLVSGRAYVVKYAIHPNSSNVTDNLRKEVRYSIGGTATAASGVLRGSVSFNPVNAGAMYWETTFTCDDSGYPAAGVASFALCFARDSGSGTCNLFCDSSRNIQLKCLRDGDEGDSGTDL